MKSEVKAVRKYKTPGYPVQSQVLMNPDLIKVLPHRWRKHAALYTAMVMTASIGMTACTGAKQDNASPTTKASAATVTTTAATTAASTTMAALTTNLRIPVFSHGDGRLGYGCVSVVPAIFLNEEDAREIILEEVSRQGIDFTGEKSICGQFPTTNLRDMEIEGYGDNPPELADTWIGELDLDGYDAKISVGFEFVSQDDMKQWCVDHGRTIYDYRIKETAEKLSDVVENTAVFYDPCVAPDYQYTKELQDSGMTRTEYLREYEKRAYEMAEELLRQQVQDFLAWLTAEGVIG